MLTIQKFTGLNNVQDAHQLGAGELTVASNVDVDLAGKLRRRAGYASASATKHTNVWEADGFTLATVDTQGDLTNVDTSTVLYASLGHERVWYCNLPDGRTLFSNGLICGIVSAAACTTWGVPIPVSIGAAADIAGSLHPGSYRYALTHVRSADGLEGGPAYSGAVTLAAGGISLSGLPTLAGHTTNVYLSSHNGAVRYKAGSTSGSTFSFTGANSALQLRCQTDYLQPAPVGKLLAFWRGRALVAVGPVLYASKPHQWELFDLQRDFKQLSADLTLVQPVEGGIFVGTDKELAFLAGSTWDQLAYASRVSGAVILGSGVTVPGKQLTIGKTTQQGDCMLCIAAGGIVAGTPAGAAVALTEGRYSTDVTEVAATFRVVDGVPQYLAVAQ